MITELCVSGVNAIVKSEECLQQIRSLFDLDGITVSQTEETDLSAETATIWQKLRTVVPDLKMKGIFRCLAMMIFCRIQHDKTSLPNPAAYAVTQEQEVGAALQCLSRKEGIPYTMVSFEVFNRNRKWSDKDVTLLTLLGHCIGDLLNYSE